MISCAGIQTLALITFKMRSLFCKCGAGHHCTNVNQAIISMCLQALVLP